VGWKKEEGTGRRVQECKWLSAKPADKTEQKPTRMRNSRKRRKSRKQKKVRKKKNKQNREQNRASKRMHEPFQMVRWNVGRCKQQAEQNNFWLCGMGVMWCHVMLCMHVADRRRCRVHGVHQNIDAESCTTGNVRASGQCRCIWIWANLVSPPCVMVDLPWKHVGRLAILSHARMWRLCHLCRRDHHPTDPRSMMNSPAHSGLGTRRKVRSASHLRVDSCPRHTQRVAASQAIRAAARVAPLRMGARHATLGS